MLTPRLRPDWRMQRDWLRPWRDPPGFFFPNCRCCTGGTTATLLVVTYPRTDMGDGLGSNTVAGCDGSGTVLWRYDKGLDSASVAFKCGQPQIDSSGNVYVPYGSTGGHGVGVIKLTAAGALVWNYSHIGGLNGGGGVDNQVQSSDFDTSGNIVFRMANANIIALKVDPSGALVTSYDYVTSGASATGVGNPLAANWGLAVDGSDNLYIHNTSAGPGGFKFDSAGTFISTFLTGAIFYYACDKTNGKLYLGFGAPAVPTTTTPIMQRWDLSTATPTKDYTKTWDNIFSPDTLNYALCFLPTMGGIGFDAATGTPAMIIGRAQSNFGGSHIVANVLSTTALGAKNWDVVTDPLSPSGVTADFIGVDPVNSGVYAASKNAVVASGATVCCVSAGTLLWSSALIAPGGNTTKGIAARTYTV